MRNAALSGAALKYFMKLWELHNFFTDFDGCLWYNEVGKNNIVYLRKDCYLESALFSDAKGQLCLLIP